MVNATHTPRTSLFRNDCGPTSVDGGTQALDGTQAYPDPISIVAILIFPTFNLLPRSRAPLKFGIPNASLVMGAAFSVRMASPDTSENVVRSEGQAIRGIPWPAEVQRRHCPVCKEVITGG